MLSCYPRKSVIIPGTMKVYVFYECNPRAVDKRSCMSLKKDNLIKQVQSPDKSSNLQSGQSVNSPKISIILLAHTADTALPNQFLKSLSSQSYSNWDLYIVTLEPLKSINEFDKIIPKNKSKQIFIKHTTTISQLIKEIKSDYLFFLNNNYILLANCLAEYVNLINTHKHAKLIYSDEAIKTRKILTKSTVIKKPCFGLDTLRSKNYIGNSFLVKKSILDRINIPVALSDSAMMYNLIFYIIETCKTHPQDFIYNISQSLLYTPVDKNYAAKEYKIREKVALENHLSRLNIKATVSYVIIPRIFKIDYKIKNNPKISIIIPNKDKINLLSKCVESIFSKSTYSNFEVIIVENNSEEKETFAYYKTIKKQYKNLNILFYKDAFNYSKINNYAVQYASGKFLVFLNNDTEVITPNWIEEMLMLCQRIDIGIVGTKLLYATDTIQHAGFYCSNKKLAHFYVGKPKNFSEANYVRNLSAVTGACIMMQKNLFLAIGSFDEQFKVELNDIDLCMQVRKHGYNVVYTPYAELYHYESQTRGKHDNEEKKLLFKSESDLFKQKWKNLLFDYDKFCPEV